MKLPIILCALCALSLPSFAEDTKTKENASGFHVGTDATQKIGFYGAPPVVQPSLSGLGGASVSGTSLQQFVVSGHNNTGAITITGAPLGAKVVGVVNLTSPAMASSSFETTLSVAGQIQQVSTSNLSAVTYLVTIDAGKTGALANAVTQALQALGLLGN